MKPLNLVTEEQVVAALRSDKGPDVHLISWDLNNFTKQGDNSGSLITSITIKYSLNHTNAVVKYVLKVYPCQPDSVDAANGMFEQEIQFYADLLPCLNSTLTELGHEPLRVPRYIYSNREYGKQLIFFEDLCLKGFQMHDRKVGLDAKHINIVFKELARLHAASHLLQNKTPGKDLTDTYDFLAKGLEDYSKEKENPIVKFLHCHVQLACDLLVRFNASENVITWTKNLLPNFEDLLKEQLGSSKYNLVSHGDCWKNNLLYKYNSEGEPVDVMLLDFQLIRRGSPALDLGQLLYGSTTRDVRKNHLDTFLHTYHTAFLNVSGNTEVIFTRDQLLQEFQDRMVFGCIWAMVSIPIVIMEFEEGEDTEKKISENWAAKEAEFAERLKSNHNPEMKSRFLSIFEDMVEAGLIPES